MMSVKVIIFFNENFTIYFSKTFSPCATPLLPSQLPKRPHPKTEATGWVWVCVEVSSWQKPAILARRTTPSFLLAPTLSLSCSFICRPFLSFPHWNRFHPPPNQVQKFVREHPKQVRKSFHKGVRRREGRGCTFDSPEWPPPPPGGKLFEDFPPTPTAAWSTQAREKRKR